MNVWYEEEGAFKVGAVLADNTSSLQVEAPHAGDLRTQAAAIVEKIDYLGCELKVIEVDGVSHAVQIRSRKPMADGSSKSSFAMENIYPWSEKARPCTFQKAITKS